MKRVLVVCAHPDDEAVGLGGTLRRHVLDGDEVKVVFLTSGEAGGHGVADAGGVREREAHAAARVLGLDDLEFWRGPDGALAETPTVARLAGLLGSFRPDVVYVHHDAEMHPDHRVAAIAALAAVETCNGDAPQVLGYEVWTPLAEMHVVVDVSDWVEDKLAAIRCYESQCRVLAFDEAFRGLMRYRGEMHSWPGGAYAEVFRRLR